MLGLVLVAVLGGVLVLTSCSRAEVPSGPTGVAGSWQLVWHDEFSGSELDGDRWSPQRHEPGAASSPFNPAQEAAWFSPDAVRVADGHLVITLTEGERRIEGRSYPYRSGVVQATAGSSVQPGSYVEARIQVPRCDGCWPAFWATPRDRWPPEIDVFEYFDTSEQTRPAFTYHRPDGTTTGSASYGEEGTDVRDGFHVYGLLWDGRTAVPYLDGRPYPAVAAEQDMTALPMMLIVNLSVMAGHSPRPGAQLLVDWVRVWRPGD